MALHVGRAFALALGLVLLTSGTFAHEIKYKELTILHPWVAPTDQRNSDAVVSLKIRNRGKAADRLLGATSPRAARIMLEGPSPPSTPNGIDVAAGAEVVLNSAGLHLTLHDLNKPLIAYDTFPLTLVFEKAGKVEVEVMVED